MFPALPSIFLACNNLFVKTTIFRKRKQNSIGEKELRLLKANTRFEESEILQYLKSFDKNCPSGRLELDMFESLYKKFYPYGQTRSFAKKAFTSFDRDMNGYIDFEEFLLAIDVMSSRNAKKKFNWFFTLSDTKKDGVIDQAELDSVLTSISEMVTLKTSKNANANRLLKMEDYDEEQKGFLTKTQFFKFCADHGVISQFLFD